ncbi:uncharacterized protein LOC124722624 [Schistocerca piceifrons]|uniref:uncharacterized protein LOC124722624 n=1 Tax=Schistocerca piceifrons TaxID=274613 RepID=UPI001F5EFA4C|nr:uncharacterized protein LOC124722624 [Schistocerca piceifrons]
MLLKTQYLGSGCNLIDLHYKYKIGYTTLSKIVRKVCKAVREVLREECIPKFTEERCMINAKRLERHADFPKCLGTLDDKHVRIVKPDFSGSQFYNYKKFHSIVLFVVADANCLLTMLKLDLVVENRIALSSKIGQVIWAIKFQQRKEEVHLILEEMFALITS